MCIEENVMGIYFIHLHGSCISKSFKSDLNFLFLLNREFLRNFI